MTLDKPLPMSNSPACRATSSSPHILSQVLLCGCGEFLESRVLVFIEAVFCALHGRAFPTLQGRSDKPNCISINKFQRVCGQRARAVGLFKVQILRFTV